MQIPRLSAVRTFLASRAFFRLVLAIFVFEALWVALSALYPMAFDEDFHLGIIRIYAHHWLPFLPDNVEPSGVYGAVSHEPSFLYHYLMSFPYRLISLFTNDQTIQVILLRLINIALFGGALVLFRKLLLKTGLSGAFSNLALLLFVLIPIVPLVAGQINYDNLEILLTAWLLLSAVGVSQALRKRRVPLTELGTFIVVGMAGCVVKYAFLPIFAAAVLVLAVQAAWTFRRSWGALHQSLLTSYRAMSTASKAVLVILFVIFGIFWGQRYGLNLVRYHKAIPDCATVLSIEQCKNYGPWGRDYSYTQGKNPNFRPNPISFTHSWFKGMWRRTFFVINGNVANGRYQNVAPLPLPKYTGAAVFFLGIVATIVCVRRVFAGRWDLFLLLAVILLYCGALFNQNYHAYARTGVVVAVNGRYLLLVMMAGAAIAGRALSFRLRGLPKVKLIVAGVAVLLMLEGGVFEFIVQSNNLWYWPNQTVQNVNNTARNILQPLAVGNSTRHRGP